MFYVSTYLPRLDKTAKVREFTNQHYIDLAKFYFNKDNEGIGNFFDSVLEDLIINKEIIPELTCIEKFIIWLNIFYSCVHDTISLFSSSLNDTVRVKVTELIKRASQQLVVEERYLELEDITITLNAPRSIVIKDADSIFDNVIYSIRSDGETYFYSDFSAPEKEKFLESLPSDLFDDVKDYYKELNSNPIDILPQNEKVQFAAIEVSPANGTMFAILKSIFQADDIGIHYNNALIFTKDLGGSYDSYLKMTPRDFTSMYKINESYNRKEKSS